MMGKLRSIFAALALLLAAAACDGTQATGVDAAPAIEAKGGPSQSGYMGSGQGATGEPGPATGPTDPAT